MSKEQFQSLTRLQKRVALNSLRGLSVYDSYMRAGGTAKSENSRNATASQILHNPKVQAFLNSMKTAVADAILCTSHDIARALMKEAGLTDEIIKDTKQSSRVAALKALSDYTGGFDRNRQKVEHTGYIEMSEDDLYDSEEES